MRALASSAVISPLAMSWSTSAVSRSIWYAAMSCSFKTAVRRSISSFVGLPVFDSAAAAFSSFLACASAMSGMASSSGTIRSVTGTSVQNFDWT